VADWDCEAYGPDGRKFGALCFLAEPGERVCASQAACHEAMDGERRRVYRRIQEMAAADDPAGAELADVFTDPGQILGGGDD